MVLPQDNLPWCTKVALWNKSGWKDPSMTLFQLPAWIRAHFEVRSGCSGPCRVCKACSWAQSSWEGRWVWWHQLEVHSSSAKPMQRAPCLSRQRGSWITVHSCPVLEVYNLCRLQKWAGQCGTSPLPAHEPLGCFLSGKFFNLPFLVSRGSAGLWRDYMSQARQDWHAVGKS